jgi:rhodanese-related sulfurtransferase
LTSKRVLNYQLGEISSFKEQSLSGDAGGRCLVERNNMTKRMFALVVFALAVTWAGPFSMARGEDVKKILSIEAFDMLNTLPDTYLIDVRTRAEYQFVGHPYKAYNFPYMFFTTRFVKEGENQGYQLQKNKAFLDQINKAFKKTDNLLILGRDGTRSALGAKELANAGFKNVYDVYDGFEGPEFPYFEDPNRHKFYRQLAKRYKIPGFELRRHYGWQWWGLPWTYEMDPKYVYPPDLTPPEK